MLAKLFAQLITIIAFWAAPIKDHLSELVVLEGPEDLLELERWVHQLALALADQIVGLILKANMARDELRRRSARMARAHHPGVRAKDRRDVNVRLLGGHHVRLRVSYYYREADEDRNVESLGCYPQLEALGIFERATPALTERVALHATAAASTEEAKRLLASQGLNLSTRVIRRLTLRLGQRQLLHLEALFHGIKERFEELDLKGRRVQISVDGGRWRERINKPGRPLKSGYHGFETPWREPKLMILQVLDDQGRKDPNLEPIALGCVKDKTEFMALMRLCIEVMGLDRAASVILVADGADWIWNNWSEFAEELGLEEVVEVYDFYHAVKYLGDVGKELWKKSGARRRWQTLQRKRLKRGRSDLVLEDLEKLAKKHKKSKKKSEALRKALTFMKGHEEAGRLDYARFEEEKIPRGSGAIESLIRRVLNQRLKGPGTFWYEENLAAMLQLRIQLKTGQWERAFRASLYPHAEVDLRAAS